MATDTKLPGLYLPASRRILTALVPEPAKQVRKPAKFDLLTLATSWKTIQGTSAELRKFRRRSYAIRRAQIGNVDRLLPLCAGRGSHTSLFLIEPYQGEIVLCPEIFQEVKED